MLFCMPRCLGLEPRRCMKHETDTDTINHQTTTTYHTFAHSHTHTHSALGGGSLVAIVCSATSWIMDTSTWSARDEALFAPKVHWSNEKTRSHEAELGDRHMTILAASGPTLGIWNLV